MTNSRQLIKFPHAIYEPKEDLKSGDILVFNMNPRSTRIGNYITRKMQRYLNAPAGHSNTEHAALVLKIGDELKLVHLLGRGFTIEDLTHIDKRTTHVYRISNEEHREKINKHLTELIDEKAERFNRSITWRSIISVFSYCRRLINALGVRKKTFEPTPVREQEHAIDGSSICSKFVADCYIEACRRTAREDHANRNDYKDNYMNIFSATTPKTLQAYLGRNANYEYHLLPHARRDIYTKLQEVIMKEANRLISACHCHEALMKGRRLKQLLNQHRADENHPFNSAIGLLKSVTATLKINHGTGLGRTTAHINVMKFAKAQGIYRAYINDNSINDDEEHYIEAKADLGNDRSEERAELYSHFRHRGLSDQEARFETNPSFIKWAKVNPRRVAASLCSGIGLFAVPIFGAIRCKLAKNRNDVMLQELSQRPRPAM